LVEDDDNDPLHEVQVQLDVQSLGISVNLLFLLRTVRTPHSDGAFVTHITEEVQVAHVVDAIGQWEPSLFGLFGRLPLLNLGLVTERLVGVEGQLKEQEV